MSAKQQEADEIVARSAEPDGTIASGLALPLGEPVGWTHWECGDKRVDIDGGYTAEILIALGKHMLAHTKAERSET